MRLTDSLFYGVELLVIATDIGIDAMNLIFSPFSAVPTVLFYDTYILHGRYEFFTSANHPHTVRRRCQGVHVSQGNLKFSLSVALSNQTKK